MIDLQPDISEKLPKRDYFLIPLLSLSTVALIFAAAEIGSRLTWVEDEHDVCFTQSPAGVYRHIPNCVARMKNAEGPWLEYKYNACGYRGNASCGPKPPGTVRIALLGSSTSAGMFVPYEQTLGALVSAKLSKACGQPVEVQNLGVAGAPLASVSSRVDEALALKPDLVILPVTIFDLEAAQGALPPPKAKLSWYARLKEVTKESRASAVISHYLFRDGQVLLAYYLRLGNQQDLMHTPLSPWLSARFSNVDAAVGAMAEKMRKAGVPLFLTAVPSRTEAVLLNAGKLPPELDPLQFGREISRMASAHALPYIDVLEQFRRTPEVESAYYPVDSHLNARGQGILAEAIASRLISGCAAHSLPPNRHG